jgi:hypothetical protein
MCSSRGLSGHLTSLEPSALPTVFRGEAAVVVVQFGSSRTGVGD